MPPGEHAVNAIRRVPGAKALPQCGADSKPMQPGNAPFVLGALRNLADGTKFTLHPFRANTIGRANHADIRLVGKEFSRIHAIIIWDGRNWSIIDSSSNGTSVNGRSTTKMVLQSGDRLRFSFGGDWIFEEVSAEADFSVSETRIPDSTAIRIEPSGCLAGSSYVGDSLESVRLRKEIKSLSDMTSNVLITGEFGVGKRHFAQSLHLAGPARYRHFATVLCGALTREDIHTTLNSLCSPVSRAGDVPPPGTILLQQINELPMAIQEELLDLLESVSVIYRHGQEALSRPRFVSTAEKDPQLSGSILEPLMNRLFVAQYQISPLRERREELSVLASYFVRQFAGLTGRHSPRFSPEFLSKLEQYDWPANVAELRNVVERTVMLGHAENLEVWDLSSGISSSQSMEHSIYSGMSLSDVEGKHIELTLRELRWKKSHAAKVLGIERSTLDRKIEKYGIRRGDSETR